MIGELFHQTRRFRILCIIEGWVPSTKIGIEQPLEYLKINGLIDYDIILFTDVSPIDIFYNDIIIFHRTSLPQILNLLALSKKLGKSTIYDIDDNFLALPKDTELGKYYNSEPIVKSIKTFFSDTDMVKVGSKVLYELANTYNKNIILHPFSVDFDLIKNVDKPSKLNNRIVIGYAGTIGHVKDFAKVTPALNRLINEYGTKIKIEILGIELNDLIKAQEIVTFEKFNMNYEDFFINLYKRNWDIGLAPLNDTISNRSKTNNKFREYSACEIAGIYVDMPLYTDTVEHEKTGIITKHTEEDWYNNIKLLIDNDILRKSIVERAKEHVLATYSVPAISKLWVEQIIHQANFKTIDNKDVLETIITETYQKNNNNNIFKYQSIKNIIKHKIKKLISGRLRN